MRFLLSNDDGYQALGLETLARAMAAFGEIKVVAPDRNQSGSSHSLTLEAPLYAKQASNGFVYVNGTPTDCVHLAITGLLERLPDMVVSGINHGANLGDDVIYSGTVAAAMEGRFLGRPSMAVSLAGENPSHYETAAKVVENLMERLLSDPIDSELLLNVNVPDAPFEQLQGFEVTRLGHRHKSEPVIKMKDPKGQTVYWVGPAGAGEDAGLGTDFHAVAARRVSITPLLVDLTRHAALEQVNNWATNLKLHE